MERFDRPPGANARMRAIRARRLVPIAGVLALLAAHRPLDAQDCRVQYTAGTSTAATTVNMTAGEVRTFSVSGLTSLANIGTNDVDSRVSGALGATADNTLINTGSGTLVLPAAVWNGQQLQRLACRHHGTVLGAQAFLDWMGGSSQNVVDQAAAAATAAAQSEQSLMLELQLLMQDYNQALAAAEAVQQQWQNLQSSPGSLPPATEAQLQSGFPELHGALTLTQGYAIGVTSAVMEQSATNAAAIAAGVRELRDRFHGGASAAFAPPDVEQEFPEAFTLSQAQCTVGEMPLSRIRTRLEERIAEVQRLDAKYGVIAPVLAAFRLGDAAATIFQTAQAQRYCGETVEAVWRDASADAAAFRPYLEGMERDLSALAARRFERGQEHFQQDAQALADATGALLRRLDRIAVLETESSAEQQELLRIADSLAAARVESEDPVLGGATRSNLASLEQMLRLLAHVDGAATQRTAQLEAGIAAIGEWVLAAAALATEAERLRITGDGIERLVAALRAPPAQALAGARAEDAGACVADYVRVWTAAAEALQRALAAFLEELERTPTAEALEALRTRLAAVGSAASALYNYTGQLYGLGRSVHEGYPALSDALFELGQALALVRQDFEHASGVLPALEAVIAAAEAIVLNLPAFHEDVRRLYELRDELNAEIAALAALVDSMSREVQSDFRTLVAADSFVDDGIAAVGRGYDDLHACVTRIRTAALAAREAMPARIAAALETRAAAALAEVLPEAVLEALDRAVTHAEALLEAVQAFSLVRQDVATLVAAVHEARDAVRDALLPAPQADAVARIQQAFASASALQAGMGGYHSAAGTLGAAHTAYDGTRLALAEALRMLEMEAGGEAAALMYAAFDAALVNQEYTNVTGLVDAWALAQTTFANRAIAFGWSALVGSADDTYPAIAAGMQSMADQLAEMLACHAGAEQVRATLASPTLVTAAVQTATAGIATDAAAVFQALSSLLQPTIDLLATVANTFAAAQALQQRVAAAPADAVQAFKDTTSQAKAQFDEHRTCAHQRAVAVMNAAALLSAQMPVASAS